MNVFAVLARRLCASLIVLTMAGAVLTVGNTAYAADVATVPLGTSANYSVLGASTVTNTGAQRPPRQPRALARNVDHGLPTGVGRRSRHDRDNDVRRRSRPSPTSPPPTTTPPAGRSTRRRPPISPTSSWSQASTPGPSKSPLSLTGPLVLDGAGDANSVFIFQTNSSLTTASGSTVTLINGAQECNVFWQVGSSATLGTGSVFAGNILALSSITVTTGVTVHGRALARNAAVTLDNDTFTTPTCAVPISAGRQAPPTTEPGSPTAPGAPTTGEPGSPTAGQPGTPTAGQPGSPGQPGVPPTSLAFTGTEVVFPLVLGMTFLFIGVVIMRIERARKLKHV